MLATKNIKNVLLLVVLLVVAYFSSNQSRVKPPQRDDTQTTATDSDQILSAAFENHRRNVEVQGSGKVARILPDDTEGLRHQKFILRLASGQELLVAHDIDFADRIPDLEKGDVIEFRGEYEWNPQGGVLHWTHRDSKGRHPDGWLKHNGQIYQ